MIESEAKTKWCPFVRFTALGDIERDSNRDTDTKVATCIGSECMAWQSEARVFEQGAKMQSAVLTEDGSVEVAPDTSPRGYCGLVK